LITALLYLHVSAQDVLERVYDVGTGLPFQEATGVHKDKKGFLWVEYSNQEYISRFDGITWTHYRFTDYGMPPGLAFDRETKDGLWFKKINTISGLTDLALMDQRGVWHLFSIKGIVVIDYFQITKKITYCDQEYRLHQFGDTSFVATDIVIPRHIIGEDYLHGLVHIDDHTFLITLSRRDKTSDIYKSIYYEFVKKTVVYVDSTDSKGGFPGLLTPFKYFKNFDFRYGYDVKGQRSKFPVKGPASSPQTLGLSYFRNDNNLSGAITIPNNLKKKDVYLFDDHDNSLNKIYSDLHEGYISSSIVKDPGLNIWYATHSGLFRRNPHIFTFSESSSAMVNGLHTIAEDDQGKIWFGGYNQTGWSYWDGISLKRPKAKGLLSNRVLPGSANLYGRIWFFEESFEPFAQKYIQNDRLGKMIFPDMVSPGYYFTRLKSGKIGAGLAGKGLLIFDPEKPSDYVIKNKDNGLLLQNVLTISEDNHNRLWMGRMSQGVACYDPTKDTVVTWQVSNENPKSLGMIASKTDIHGDLWMGTSKGLYILSEPHQFDILKQSLFDRIEQVPLPGDYHDRVSSIAESSKYLIAGSDKGLHLIDKSVPTDKEGRRRTYVLWYGEDIPGKGSEQNAILLDSKGYLWVGTNEGALRLDIHHMSFDTTPTSLSLVSIKIGGAEFELNTDKITGPKGQRSLDITWVAAGNHHFQNNVFATILVLTEKNDTVFFKNQTKDKNFNLPHLSPDTYRLIIKGYKNNQLSAVLEKKILIPKLLSERASFWAVMAIVLTLIPFLLILNISRARRKQAEYDLTLEKAKRNQDSYRIKSLSNFFNPHFINNTLHWLQSKYRKDAETATMIDSLASNVELLYQNMQQGTAFHSLKKELELVDNYLAIQQVRFDHMLIINRNVDPNLVINNIPVPSMLLQIHVENAVEKGIRNRAGAGLLSICVADDRENINITIEDDGRGRTNISPDDDGRKGSTQVMNDLIAILNSYNKSKITVLYDDHIIDRKYGTRVNITLPKNFNYAFEKI
jgi:ligand-binding sensor domain-containing protein